MKKFAAIAFIGFSSVFTSSIYTKKYTTLSGTQVSMAQYQGKKILLVNIASASQYAAVQLPQLEQLYQLHKDSLVVIGFPSNDFDKEPRNNANLKLLLEKTYRISFPVSVRTGVKDNTASTHPIYKWLQDKNENGDMNMKVKKDFQKFLIDKDGTIIGIFSTKTSPLDNVIINAITQ
jgi:glutathione peroxidase